MRRFHGDFVAFVFLFFFLFFFFPLKRKRNGLVCLSVLAWLLCPCGLSVWLCSLVFLCLAVFRCFLFGVCVGLLVVLRLGLLLLYSCLGSLLCFLPPLSCLRGLWWLVSLQGSPGSCHVMLSCPCIPSPCFRGLGVCVDLLKRSKTCTVFSCRGTQHITGTVSNEATSDMGYWIWSIQRTCQMNFMEVMLKLCSFVPLFGSPFCPWKAVVSNLHGPIIIMNLAQNVLLVLSKCVCVCHSRLTPGLFSTNSSLWCNMGRLQIW